MRLVVFGLSITSAWGNGHAALLRGLFRALHEQGHEIEFFEHDTSYYRAHRDAIDFPYVRVQLYGDWQAVFRAAGGALKNADVAMVTSYCPDGSAASELVLSSNVGRTVFYDMDTPVTLSRLDRGEIPEYLPHNGLSEFDLVLSYTGGRALHQLRDVLGARQTAALYGWADPDVYHKSEARPDFQADLSYLGTFSRDRRVALERLLLEPARLNPQRRFLVAGAMYPDVGTWPANVCYREHIAPPDHATYYSSSPLTLNITRASMATWGFCPSGRLFEAAACGTPVLSDWWTGLDEFFDPGQEILIADSSTQAVDAINMNRAELERIGLKARERTLDCHTAQIRAQEFIKLIQEGSSVECSGLRHIEAGV